MKIYFIRHTSVAVPKGICYGQTNVSLSITFPDEAQLVKDKLKDFRPTAVYSSPLTRCTRLADFCGFAHAITDNRLRELHFGDWEKQAWNKIDMSIWKTDWINNPAPRGESLIQLYERVSSFLNELKGKDNDTTLVFTHGGVINCAKVYFGQTSIEKSFEQLPAYGEVVGFSLNPG
jgi:Fructose-2,6-bisphosphatase